MSTTVEVKRTTAKLLEELKQKYKAKSIDETLRKLISKAEKIPDSMFGAHPKMKPFTRFHEAKDSVCVRGLVNGSSIEHTKVKIHR